ncbi:hypothetical protein ACFYYS_11750 [Streptomyces sp. NPDC002120]|uniref:hypothetical protein n=1 Tax=Streptomyces sp. NPDC002120 TaxID=3364631 RepID=UPI0036C1B73B
MFVDARGAEVACAEAQGDLPQLEVGQEVLPFLRGGLAVLLTGPQRPAAGDEGPVVVDDVLGMDRGMAGSRADRPVAADAGGDMRGQAGAEALLTKILRKSWGVYRSCSLTGPVSPLVARAPLRQVWVWLRGMARSSGPQRRWNRNGISALQSRSRLS